MLFSVLLVCAAVRHAGVGAGSPARRPAPPRMSAQAAATATHAAAGSYVPAGAQGYIGVAASTRGRLSGRNVASRNPTILVQGGSLRTWSYPSPAVEQVRVEIGTEGRPLDADIELWNGPDNTPSKMRVFVENGRVRPFSAVIATPRGPNTIAVRNIGQMELPFSVTVFSNTNDAPSADCDECSLVVQGGALRTSPFDPAIDSVEVLLRTDGRPLNARIELLQGPNNNKQVIELYAEDGTDRPFFCVLNTPGSGNVVRIMNTGPVEFPMIAAVVPRSETATLPHDAVLGGDVVDSASPGY